ncbi:hypothetical protein LPB140_03985 [Sphingorhabdus lutea]|uniref:Phosphatidate cytidylyltransferase n=1 Tax=Sphingorhabdus lutea TaxID=1913578 RepID=A0A1L3JAE6_9SPHN|nr:hypothetical protein [Sphingorhabdus lutea]APG62106.1 hypothetical protein LPB140_03985 [Sphingorhabdus lutea]
MISLRQSISAELATPVNPQINEFAEHIAQQYLGAAMAVLFYGSCLRSEKLEGEMLDFYVIVSNYDDAYEKPWMAKWNRRIPPNVFPYNFNGLAAKVAILSMDDFANLCKPEADNISVWARFSQPVRLVWRINEDTEQAIANAVASAVPTLLNAALAHSDREVGLLDLWESGFALTYGAELRAESKSRPGDVIKFDPERYIQIGKAGLYHCRIAAEIRGDKVHIVGDNRFRVEQELSRWPALRRRGKWLTILRLGKAAFTYAGGIDYLAWKINRHAGTNITIRPWQRKWPFIAAIFLLPKLLAKGAVK